MQVGARGSFTRGGPFQRDFRKSMFHDGRLYAQWMERCEEFGIDVRTVCLSVSVCLSAALFVSLHPGSVARNIERGFLNVCAHAIFLK